MNHPHRISAFLLAATALLSCPTLSANPLSDQESFLGEPTVAEGLSLLWRLGMSDASGRAPEAALKAECWRAVKPETRDVDANVDACLNAAAKLVDAQASFERFESFGRSTSTQGGIGITISKPTQRDSLVVVDVIPGTPAAASGIVAGDTVTEIDGQAVAGWTMSEVLAKLRGNPGSTVELTLEREAQVTVQRARVHGQHVELPLRQEAQAALKLSLQRARIQMEPIYDAPLKTGWYVQVREFSKGVANRFRLSLRHAARDGTLQQALVLDLRGNGGGHVQEIVDFAHVLAPELEPLMYNVGPRGLDTVRHGLWVGDDDNDATMRRQLEGLPLVVLTDRYTGSGTEWLVEVLRQRPGTWILGERTAGTARISQAFDVGYVGRFKVPVGVLFAGRGMPIDGHGIVPDEERPGEPLKVAKPPGWLFPWLEAGTYRTQPPRLRTSTATSAGAAPSTCLGDMLLPSDWPSGLESSSSRSVAVRFRSSAGEYLVSQSDLPAPEQLDLMWAHLRKRTEEARQSTSRRIAELTKELRQQRQRDAREATEARIGNLQRRLHEIGIHRLKDSGAVLVVTDFDSDERVFWIRDKHLYRLGARPRVPMPVRKIAWGDLLDRIVDRGTATAATPALCLLDGSLPLKDGETATSWTYKAEWKTADDAQVSLTMENETSNANGNSLDGLRANLDGSSSFDRRLLADHDTSGCASQPRASSRPIIAPASFAGQPAVVRAASLDRVSAADEDAAPICRTVTMINRVPLDEGVHWHRFIHLVMTSTNAARADAQVQRWLSDFNAVPPTEMPAQAEPK